MLSVYQLSVASQNQVTVFGEIISRDGKKRLIPICYDWKLATIFLAW